MKKPELFNEDHRATYMPEDDKLRLYVGRVPREEYDALRAEGWQSTQKQDCDFSAVWSVSREDTALSYAGVILDEDQGPEDRAADRAERFAGYLDKRLGEATGHADRYDSGPAVHGSQRYGQAVRAADRHDRHATRAVNAWDKAEYWQSRTAGVISHALHSSSPSVRMGRIKTIEAELRKAEKAIEEYAFRFRAWEKVRAEQDPGTAFKRAYQLANVHCHGSHYKHPRPEGKPGHFATGTSVYSLLTCEDDPVSGHEAAEIWLRGMIGPDDERYSGIPCMRWENHYRLRLAYEWQMIEAQGGRAAELEILPGGRWGGALIVKVNKSAATKRATSVSVKGRRVEGWQYKTESPARVDFSLHQFDTERAAPGTYAPPDEASLAELAEVKAAMKAASKAVTDAKGGPVSLINPTPEDAERLQEEWNDRNAEIHAERKRYGEPKRSAVLTLTQAQYSANSGGSYSRLKTETISEHGDDRKGRSQVFKLRVASSGEMDGVDRVIVISDKPQKAIPWAKLAAAKAAAPSVEKVLPRIAELQTVCSAGWAPKDGTPELQLLRDAVYCGLAFHSSLSQFGLSETGWQAWRDAGHGKASATV